MKWEYRDKVFITKLNLSCLFMLCWMEKTIWNIRLISMLLSLIARMGERKNVCRK